MAAITLQVILEALIGMVCDAGVKAIIAAKQNVDVPHRGKYTHVEIEMVMIRRLKR